MLFKILLPFLSFIVITKQSQYEKAVKGYAKLTKNIDRDADGIHLKKGTVFDIIAIPGEEEGTACTISIEKKFTLDLQPEWCDIYEYDAQGMYSIICMFISWIFILNSISHHILLHKNKRFYTIVNSKIYCTKNKSQ